MPVIFGISGLLVQAPYREGRIPGASRRSKRWVLSRISFGDQLSKKNRNNPHFALRVPFFILSLCPQDVALQLQVLVSHR